MIELNLLFKELRKQKKKDIPQIPILPISIAVMVIAVLLHISLYAFVKSKSSQLVMLEKEWGNLQPGKEKADQIARETQELDKRLKATDDIATPALDWAELMTGLNQAMIPNVWLSDFNPVFVKKKNKKGAVIAEYPVTLALTGYALGRSEISTPIAAKFINSLKKNPEFSKYFEEIELEDLRKHSIEGEEVMIFKLICKFKTDELFDQTN